MTRPHPSLEDLAAARGRLANLLTALMIAMYFGFLLLIAYQKPLLARPVVPGLTLGILLGGLVIVASWTLTWIYVRWMNRHYDPGLRNLQR